MTTPPEPPDQDAPAMDAPELTGMPRWVKLVLAMTVAVVAIALIVAVVSGGEHGPSRHGIGQHSPVAELTTSRGLAALAR